MLMGKVMSASQIVCLIILSLFFVDGSSVGREWDACIYRGKLSYYRKDREGCCQGNILRRSPSIADEICCGSQLHDSSSGMCCGGHIWYDHDTHLCCNEVVYARNEQTTCCNEQLINTTTHACCSENTIEGTGECCGESALYDPSIQHCCLGPDFRGHVHTMGRDAVISGLLECCDTEAIDTRHKLCCQGNTADRSTPFIECCGQDTFDTKTDVCCERRHTEEYMVSPLIDGRLECCGLTPYNKDNEQCCNSVITPNIGDGRCCSETAYNPLRSSCCNPYGDNPLSLSIPEIPGVQDCCSGESYLKTQQVCCSGTLQDLGPGLECCGTDLYDSSRSLCCNGNTMDRPSPTSQCCGSSTTFDPEWQTCCFGHVSDVVNGSCCMIGKNRYQTYQPLIEKCCERHSNYRPTHGRVHSIGTNCCGFHAQNDGQLCNGCSQKPFEKGSADDNAVCCGNRNPETYNTKTQVCINMRVFPRKRILEDGQQLCGIDPFNPDTRQCCNKHICPKTFEAHMSFPMQCCGTDVYVPESESCSDNMVIKGIPESVQGRCRSTPYNNATNFCDKNGLIRAIKELELDLEACYSTKATSGYYPYDPAEQQCCGEVLIGPGTTCCNNQQFVTPGTAVEEGACCGSVGYNPNTHMCCEEVLYQITARGQECCGRRSYDPSSAGNMCCNGTLFSTEDGKTECTAGVAHRPTDTVCDGVVHNVENGQCCGKTLMDSNLYICCQENFLYEKATHGDTCCGRIAYHSSDETKKCCMDSFFHNAQNFACCHSQIMDPFTETCQAIGDIKYVFPRSNNVFFCSEGNYDPTHQTCCQGLLYDFLGVCCGNEVLQKSDDNVICCNGKKQNNDYGKDAICCGAGVFNTQTYTCCGDGGLPKSSPWKICCDGVITGKRKCRARQNHLRSPSKLGHSMCGRQLYNASFQDCCDGMLYDSGLYGCLDNIVKPLCGSVPYDNETLICCSGETHDSSTTGCCDGKSYDLSKRTCCDNNLRRKKKGRTECCGGSTYNPNTDTCCGSKVARGVNHGTCCGNRTFNPAKKMCCPETKMLYRRRAGLEVILKNVGRCCAPGSEYDIDAGTCIPQACDICQAPKLTDSWKRYLHKPTLIRGTAINITSAAYHHIVHLTRVSHLNHNKQESKLDSQELDIEIPAHCGCDKQLQLDKAYVIMSDADVEEGQGFTKLVLRSTDFLARARNNLGSKVKHRLCRINAN